LLLFKKFLVQFSRFDAFLNRPQSVLAFKWMWTIGAFVDVLKLFQEKSSVVVCVVGIAGYGALSLAAKFQYERIVSNATEDNEDTSLENALRTAGFAAIGLQIALVVFGDTSVRSR
jgi:hypothetical protein